MVQEQKVVGSSLEMMLGHEIPPEHYGILAATINASWEWLFEATPDIIRKRLESGQVFVAVYGNKLPDEKMVGFNLSTYDGKIPIVFLETVALTTGGDLERIPKDYFSLTENGLWAPVSGNPDSLIMVDLTSIPSRANVAIARGKLINDALALLSGQIHGELPFNPEQIGHIGTYSPDDRQVRAMHTRYGAVDIQFRIPNSRVPLPFVTYDGAQRIVDPSFYHPHMHTNVMSYKGFGR